MRFILQPIDNDNEQLVITDLQAGVPDMFIFAPPELSEYERMVRLAYAKKVVALLNRYWSLP